MLQISFLPTKNQSSIFLQNWFNLKLISKNHCIFDVYLYPNEINREY
jgi:hypothetical protein